MELNIKCGKTYFLCACGRSENLPLCDGRHAGTEFRPVVFSAEADGIVHVLPGGITGACMSHNSSGEIAS